MATRRDNGSGSFYYIEARKQWCGTVRLGIGQRIYRYGKTKKAVVQKIKDVQREHEEGIEIGRGMTLSAYLDYWLEHVVKPNRAPGTYQNQEKIVRQHIKPYLGKKPLKKLSVEDVQKWVNEIKGKGYSSGYVGIIYQTLNTALYRAVKSRKINYNPAAYIDKPQVVIPERKPWNLEEIQAFLTAEPGHHLMLFWFVMLSLGLRLSETAKLRWEDIDFEEKTIQVRGTKTKGSNRKLPLMEFLENPLRRRLAHHLNDSFGKDRPEYIFPSPAGGTYTEVGIWKPFVQLQERHHLRRITLHDLRHCTGTFLLSQGVDHKVIQAILGHATLKTTMDTYAHVDLAMMREALSKMEAFGSG